MDRKIAIGMAVVVLALTAAAASASWQDLFGTRLIDAKGEQVEIGVFEKCELVAVYFSAQWCPPCRTFTPRLVEAYQQWQKDELPIGLVFASRDRTEEAMMGYMKDYNMSWPALPYGAAAIGSLASQHGVRGIPALLVFDREGKLITSSGRADVASKGAAAASEWLEKAR